MQNVSKEWKIFQSKLPEARYNNYSQTTMDEDRNKTGVIRFSNVQSLTCEHILSGHTRGICAL